MTLIVLYDVRRATYCNSLSLAATTFPSGVLWLVVLLHRRRQIFNVLHSCVEFFAETFSKQKLSPSARLDCFFTNKAALRALSSAVQSRVRKCAVFVSERFLARQRHRCGTISCARRMESGGEIHLKAGVDYAIRSGRRAYPRDRAKE